MVFLFLVVLIATYLPPKIIKNSQIIAEGIAKISQSLLFYNYFFNKLERETGFEPATSSLGSLRSTVELFPHY